MKAEFVNYMGSLEANHLGTKVKEAIELVESRTHDKVIDIFANTQNDNKISGLWTFTNKYCGSFFLFPNLDESFIFTFYEIVGIKSILNSNNQGIRIEFRTVDDVTGTLYSGGHPNHRYLEKLAQNIIYPRLKK